jgi:protein TonB
MKRYLIYSLILHIFLISLSLVIGQVKKEKEIQPFYARIITPDELRQQTKPPARPAPPPARQPVRPRAEKPTQKPADKSADKSGRMPKLPEDIPPPKELSAVPSPAQKKESPDEDAAGTTVETQTKGTKTETLSRQKQDLSPDIARIDSADKDATANKSGQDLPLKPGTTQQFGAGSVREKLFDRDVIGKLAQKGGANAKSEGNVTFDTGEFRYYGYLQRLREKIEGVWRYPPDAAARGVYGDLYVRFTIRKDGRLGAVELVRTSGHRSLDDAAIRALREAEPFWPLPEEWNKDGLTITGRFVYSLHGVYIR